MTDARGATSAFPPGFLWGAATAAYQIEGSAAVDGKGESIWDRFVRTPGTVADGSTGDVACDSYLRWREDVALLGHLRLNAYRFSLSWPRILPEGRGAVNMPGVDYYDRLVDALLEAGITPMVTLYHWDLPQALQERGGWLARDTAARFAELAQVAARRLGDRVHLWVTLNEPHIVTHLGHVSGEMAPGLRDRRHIAPVAHHLLLAHGLATQAVRALATRPQLGLALNFTLAEPATDRAADVAAAAYLDGLWHRWYADPLFHGTYPEDIVPRLAIAPDLLRAGDLATIAAPLDFLGVNYYTRVRVRAARGKDREPTILPPAGALTTMGWEVYPEGLRLVMERVWREYRPPALYITENGAAYPDTLAPDDTVHDPQRTAYLREHLHAAQAALAAGVPLRGYFAWSLMDNFEWARGFVPRFGLAYTDYATQRRIPKASGAWLREVAASNGAALAAE